MFVGKWVSRTVESPCTENTDRAVILWPFELSSDVIVSANATRYRSLNNDFGFVGCLYVLIHLFKVSVYGLFLSRVVRFFSHCDIISGSMPLNVFSFKCFF